MTAAAQRQPIALTMGDPAGIGGEIAMAAWARREAGTPVFALLDDPVRLAALARRIHQEVPIAEIGDIAEAPDVFGRGLPVLRVPVDLEVAPGRPEPRAAAAVIASIDRAVDLAMSGEAAGIVTNPVHKETLYGAGFAHPGHTEYLAARSGASGAPVMLLACEALRVVPVTIHLPLKQAIEALDAEGIVHCGTVLADSLIGDFGIGDPVIAVAGLNPHAGESGHLGREEIDIIAPAIARLAAKGIRAIGPMAPDTMFHEAARRTYDAALCMYHDQALIPLKTIDFMGGVNATLGLPIVRTSPDHGTAFDIAGTGRADPSSLVAAIRLAAEIADHRRGGGRRRAIA